MRRHSKLVVLASVTAATALALSACSSSKNKGSSSDTSSGKTVAAAYNAANSGVVNASTHTGGVVKYA